MQMFASGRKPSFYTHTLTQPSLPYIRGSKHRGVIGIQCHTQSRPKIKNPQGMFEGGMAFGCVGVWLWKRKGCVMKVSRAT